MRARRPDVHTHAFEQHASAPTPAARAAAPNLTQAIDRIVEFAASAITRTDDPLLRRAIVQHVHEAVALLTTLGLLCAEAGDSTGAR